MSCDTMHELSGTSSSRVVVGRSLELRSGRDERPPRPCRKVADELESSGFVLFSPRTDFVCSAIHNAVSDHANGIGSALAGVVVKQTMFTSLYHFSGNLSFVRSEERCRSVTAGPGMPKYGVGDMVKRLVCSARPLLRRRTWATNPPTNMCD